jgi:hypothetical protein
LKELKEAQVRGDRAKSVGTMAEAGISAANSDQQIPPSQIEEIVESTAK